MTIQARRRAVAVSAVAMLLLAATTASAGTLSGHETVTNATGACQAALPAFDGLIRKRPLALQNEGAAPAFVTCSVTTETDFGGSEGTDYVVTWFVNLSGTEKTINCTFVIGAIGTTAPINVVRSLVLAGGENSNIFLDSEDVGGGARFPGAAPVNFSCSLPPQTGIGRVYVGWST